MVDPKIIEQIKNEGNELAKQIADLIDEFQLRNHVGARVEISRLWSIDRGPLHRPQVTVKLEL